MKYHFKVHRERSGGFWAECIELEGCRTEANSRAQLEKNMKAALNLYLSEPPNSKHIFPAPKKSKAGRNIALVAPRPSVAMANRIRELRLLNNLTQIGMKDRLGIKNLSNYQRLEDPERANPEWQTLVLIKKAFPDFRVDDLMAS
jgi:antitoxin HicB